MGWWEGKAWWKVKQKILKKKNSSYAIFYFFYLSLSLQDISETRKKDFLLSSFKTLNRANTDRADVAP